MNRNWVGDRGNGAASLPVDLNPSRLRRWAEADAKFLSMVCEENRRRATAPSSPPLFQRNVKSDHGLDGFGLPSGRERFLRSYTFHRPDDGTTGLLEGRSFRCFKFENKPPRQKKKNNKKSKSLSVLEAFLKLLLVPMAKNQRSPSI